MHWEKNCHVKFTTGKEVLLAADFANKIDSRKIIYSLLKPKRANGLLLAGYVECLFSWCICIWFVHVWPVLGSYCAAVHTMDYYTLIQPRYTYQ